MLFPFCREMADDDVILKDQEVEISRREFKSIQDGMCCGDLILYYKFRCLERKYSELYKNHYFYTFMPTAIQFIQAFPLEMVKDSFSHFKPDQYKFVFFPLMDFDVRTQSATHWSFLYIDNRDGQMKLKHFDSNGQGNYDTAVRFVSIISQVFDIPNKEIEPLCCASQNNCYDCGVYVMAYADELLSAKGDHEAANSKLTPSYCYQYRKEFREFIWERGQEMAASSK
ncbi:hypothetical protein TRFO_02398 [Tritrichomonas foetus]|uniref:Ubiquitin-like protease family profile domain-containing protein n=1 Tax=Tritrichomonas foetus TaxID=1144522 RepID=A0A1J4J335_9EUKA|nr:hypothetical protein TRFO_02398 [Tritrichomonas foetus]|eukprot:OHS93864.1 hypothetical protein TRFO_02398 [Tritrichomonas foetus]